MDGPGRDQLLSFRQAAQLLGIDRRTLTKWARHDNPQIRLPTHREAGREFIHRDVVEHILADRAAHADQVQAWAAS